MSTDVVPVLRVSDAASAVAWYRRLDFGQTFEHRFEPELPAYVGIRRDGSQIHLSEHAGDARPVGLLYLWVDDVDAISSEFGVAVEEQPWGREVRLTDPDGNRLRIAERVGGTTVDELLGDGTTMTLVGLERAMWDGSTRGDRAWMDEHLAPAFREFGWSGREYGRTEILDLEVGRIDVELDGFVVRALGRDAALVTYRSLEERGHGHRSSVWVRHDRHWLLEFHQGTPGAA
jgi:predicted enzyme related to lactoylglutathione lyase